MADILILEPDEKLGKKMCEILRRAGHHCMRATTIADGLAQVKDADRMLTLLNARLPWADSFTLLKTLSAKGWPVLFMTCDASNSSHLQALYQGSSAVLLSPFDGKAGKMSRGTEYKLEVRCPVQAVPEALAAVRAYHPYEQPVVNILPLYNGLWGEEL